MINLKGLNDAIDYAEKKIRKTGYSNYIKLSVYQSYGCDNCRGIEFNLYDNNGRYFITYYTGTVDNVEDLKRCIDTQIDKIIKEQFS